jgi:hypothetical protein
MAAAISRTRSGWKDAPQASGGEDRGGPGGEAGQALLVRDGRDGEPARRDDLRLQAAQRPDGVRGRHRPGAEDPGELPEAVADELGERRPGGPELALHRGHVAVLGLVAQPDAGQLRGLLLQGHPGEQVRDPLGGGPRRIPPQLHVLFDHRPRRHRGTFPIFLRKSFDNNSVTYPASLARLWTGLWLTTK